MNIQDLGIFKLQENDHETPGDGLCFMEAVAWMAGEEHSDAPKCACPILGTFGIILNDYMGDDLRDMLNPMVLKMAGTRSKEHELHRLEYIILNVYNRIFPKLLNRDIEKIDKINNSQMANTVQDHEETFKNLILCLKHYNLVKKNIDGHHNTMYLKYGVKYIAYTFIYKLNSYKTNSRDKIDIYTEVVAIFDEAINLGPHGGEFYDVHEVRLQKYLEIA
jgi:hypothetical protein